MVAGELWEAIRGKNTCASSPPISRATSTSISIMRCYFEATPCFGYKKVWGRTHEAPIATLTVQ